jgi:hypothetical protein
MNKKMSLALTAGGMAALLTGNKLGALAMFGMGAAGLEKHWRVENADVPKGFSARWDRAISFYNQTHQEPTNRNLHQVGIPMILGGAIGLVVFPAFRPMWLASAASFTTGWALNFIGHGLYEKNKPAFADDPLSFIAGPIWDLDQLRGKGKVSLVKGEQKAS